MWGPKSKTTNILTPNTILGHWPFMALIDSAAIPTNLFSPMAPSVEGNY